MRDRSRITAVLVAALLAVVPLLLPHYTLATSAMTQALGPRDTTVPADASASASPSATLVVTATVTPTATATVTPTLTPSPTSSPSSSATATQTPSPTITPTRTATPKPSATRTATPKPSATRTPTRTPTVRPTATPQAHMTVSPLSINPGGVLTVGGNTFVPGETVYIGLDGAIYASAHADSSGTAPATGFAVPLTTAPGSHTVFIQGGSSNRRVQTTVTITRLIPAIRLDRASAAPNETLCVTGTTFLPYETVTVAVNSVAVASASAAFDGSFTQCFRVPANIISGSNDVTAVGSYSQTQATAHLTGLLTVASNFYFVGASTAGGDDTTIPIVNSQSLPALVTLTIYRANEAPLTRTVEIGAFSRGTIVLSAYLQGARSLGVRVQADRTIGAAMVVRRGINSPFATVGNSVLAKRWYLAEGYTGLTFHERIYVLNPQSSDAGVQLRLLPARGGKSRIATYVVPARRTYSIDVNALAPHSSVAAVVTGTVPILVERVLTFGDGGDGAAGETGSTQAATNWLFADGNTAKEAETYVTILNPGQRPAIVTALIFDTRGHLLGGRSVTVEGLQRGTIRLNDLAHASGIAINVTSSQPVVVERSMYDGNPNKGQRRGSVVLGRNGTGRSWLFPDGDTSIGSREYLFALNPNGATLKLHASIYLSNGRELGKDFTVSGGARLTIDVGRMIPGALGSLHATRLTSLNNVGFVAEQAISNPDIDSGYETAGTAG